VGHAASGGKRYPDAEGDGRDPLDINADELCRRAVLYRCAQARAKLRTVQQQIEATQQRDRQDEAKDIDISEVEIAYFSARLRDIPGMELDQVRAELDAKHPFDDERDAEGDQDG